MLTELTLAALSAASPGFAPAPAGGCPDLVPLLIQLAEDHGETARFHGLMDAAVGLAVTLDEADGSWTLLSVGRDGKACVLAFGSLGQSMPAPEGAR